MKKTITLNDFRNMLADYNRTANFSYYGAEILFNALEMLEEDTGEEMEADIIGLCCDFTEQPVSDWAKEQGDQDITEMNEAEQLEALSDRTWVLGTFQDENGQTIAIYQNY